MDGSNGYASNASQYFIAFALSISIFIFVAHAWQHSLFIPYSYSGDAVFTSSWIKSIIETGWFLTNPNLGAPNGYTMIDFPMADDFHFFIIKLLTFFTTDYAIILNIFYVLTFPSVTLAALFVLKRFGLSYPLALAASLLFSFLPYHFLHGQAHLFLSSYYVVPLVIWLAISIVAEDNQPISTKKHYMKWGLLFLLSLMIGSSGVYYAFFGIFYLFVSGLIAAVIKKQWAPIRRMMIFVILITFSGVLNIMPYFLQGAAHRHLVERYPFQSELFGLKITPLVLPTEYHRVSAFAEIREKYLLTTKGKDSEMTGALGVIGDIGFLILLGTLLLSRPSIRAVGGQLEKFHQIAKLNLCGTLLATVGGFGTLFAYMVSPMIRCYDRMSIYLGFFSLYAFFYMLQKILNNTIGSSRSKTIWLICLIILCLGLYDETMPNMITNYITNSSTPMITASVNSDKKFVQHIESTIPTGSAIFQLPYIVFPENNYDHFKLYLYSHNLKWSFGAMAGSDIEIWQFRTAHLPVPDMLTVLLSKGFTGISIDRSKYPDDHAAGIEAQLSQLTGRSPVVSDDGSRSFFDLRSYKTRTTKKLG